MTSEVEKRLLHGLVAERVKWPWPRSPPTACAELLCREAGAGGAGHCHVRGVSAVSDIQTTSPAQASWCAD